MRELKNIFPPKTKVLFGEEVIEIKSVKLKDLEVVAGLADKIFDKMVGIILSKKSEMEIGLDIAKELVKIFKDDVDSLIDLLAITTSVKKEVLSEISLEASLFLLDEVLEVNKSFLFQSVFPKAKELFAKYSKKTNGLLPSKD